jgi:potassium efflux system protein
MHKRICLLLFLCTIAISVYAQNLKDSIFKVGKDNATTAPISTASAADTSFSAIIQRIDYYSTKFNEINTQLNEGFDTLEISDDLPEIESRQAAFKNNAFNGKALTIRYLSSFQDYFANTRKQLDKWEKLLSIQNEALVEMQEILCGLTTDSTFKNLPADSALRSRFFTRINSLGPKWYRLDSISLKAIANIGFLQNRVSAAQLQVIDFNEQIKSNLKRLNEKTFSKEFDYFWDIKINSFFKESKDALYKTLVINYRILTFYLKYSYKVHLINFCIFFLLFIWLSKNRNTILKDQAAAKSVFQNALLTSKYPMVSALAVTCTIGPFFYYHPPIILNQIYLIVLMVCVGVLMNRSYSKSLILCWFAISGFVLLFSLSNVYFEVYPSERVIFFVLNAFLLLFSTVYFRKYQSKIPEKYQSKINNLIYCYYALLVFALFANFFGRYSLSKIATTTALFTIVEGFSLLIFIKIITEGIFLQMEVGKIKVNTMSSYLDFKNLNNRIGRFLKLLSICLLIIFFIQNLGVFDSIFDATKNFLIEVRKIGKTTFTFGGFILFIFIIYLASVIAKVVTYFFEFADEQALKKTRKAKFSSSLLLVRLSIWIIGFLIAIAASGIALDKLTIILGALGVGIGFGLQNIANNVVSGLVMVFEKPIQVGDLIEVGDKTGTVRSMGIRASKILTLEGSEVIVPNGDLLSQNLINWTLSNTHKRICLEVGVAYGTDIDKVKTIFKQILDDSKEVMKDPEPLILLHDFAESSVNFNLLCWVADIDEWLTIKSILMSQIYEAFYKQGIKIPFPQRDVNVYLKEDFVKDKLPAKPKKTDI